MCDIACNKQQVVPKGPVKGEDEAQMSRSDRLQTQHRMFFVTACNRASLLNRWQLHVAPATHVLSL